MLTKGEAAMGNPTTVFRGEVVTLGPNKYNSEVTRYADTGEYVASISWATPKFGEGGSAHQAFDTEEAAKNWLASTLVEYAQKTPPPVFGQKGAAVSTSFAQHDADALRYEQEDLEEQHGALEASTGPSMSEREREDFYEQEAALIDRMDAVTDTMSRLDHAEPKSGDVRIYPRIEDRSIRKDEQDPWIVVYTDPEQRDSLGNLPVGTDPAEVQRQANLWHAERQAIICLLYTSPSPRDS